MGAIWDFIAGKSNDWDRVEREQSSSSSSGNYSSRKRKRIGAYCKTCGHTVQERFSDSIDDKEKPKVSYENEVLKIKDVKFDFIDECLEIKNLKCDITDESIVIPLK